MAALIADDETFPIYETPGTTDARRWWIAQTRRVSALVLPRLGSALTSNEIF
jgi:hypothetical protein